ncbi:phage protein NinX family protein [Burkholderia vietnamiensis]|uniref:phage protein NinX family protein n=1 Tax=Burkholderia vietnamiensis TaxID=60552 RepID=UPI001CB14E05|nr:phage protein NinX family protein [Burkholderia vietnamiensis]CAG9229347.1 conserved hypothetical protein [Burkholderia vietnamiensis]HDR9086280.1 DUF2591 family protein [Burkholderia vietnamiensis]
MKREFRTEELTGAELDYFVAKALADRMVRIVGTEEHKRCEARFGEQWSWDRFSPSSAWAHCGPLVQRERINLNAPGPMGFPDPKKLWCAFIDTGSFAGSKAWFGATALEAACRAYVALKLGSVVTYTPSE